MGPHMLAPVLVLVLALLLPMRVTADRCTCLGVPGPTAGDTVTAYEPAQRAIILWNGTAEVLFLSTDLAYKSTVTLNEVIALPAQPSAS